MADARFTLGHDADLARSAVCALADRCRRTARARPRGIRARSVRRAGVGRSCAVPHVERRATRRAGAAMVVGIPRVERAHLRANERTWRRVFLQSRRDQSGRCRHRAHARAPAVLHRGHDSRRQGGLGRVPQQPLERRRAIRQDVTVRSAGPNHRSPARWNISSPSATACSP